MKNLIIITTVLLWAIMPASAQLFHSKSHKNLTLKANQHYQATIKTSKGTIVVKLYNETPIHRDNFVKLIQSDFYNGIIFHRVIKDFMIQAGDPGSKEGSEVRTYGDNDTGYKLPSEINPNYFHRKGALAAARESDDVNPARQSSGSQFYIVTGKVLNDSIKSVVNEKIKFMNSWEMTPQREQVYRTEGGAPHLDGNYTIFGQVVRGQKVVDAISKKATYKNDRPRADIYIKKITLKVVNDKADSKN